MIIEAIWQAGKPEKLESKKSSWTGQKQTVSLFQGTTPLVFDLLTATGEKVFDPTNGGMRMGKIELYTENGDLRFRPASSGVSVLLPEVLRRAQSGEVPVVDVFAWRPEFRSAGSNDDRSWPDCFIQGVTVLDDKMNPTSLTLRNYNDFEADCLPVGVHHAEFVLTTRRHSGRSYPAFRLDNVVPVSEASVPDQAVNG